MPSKARAKAAAKKVEPQTHTWGMDINSWSGGFSIVKGSTLQMKITNKGAIPVTLNVKDFSFTLHEEDPSFKPNGVAYFISDNLVNPDDSLIIEIKLDEDGEPLKRAGIFKIVFYTSRLINSDLAADTTSFFLEKERRL